MDYIPNGIKFTLSWHKRFVRVDVTHGGDTICVSEAKCHENDEYDFQYGVNLAMERAIAALYKPEKMDVVKLRSDVEAPLPFCLAVNFVNGNNSISRLDATLLRESAEGDPDFRKRKYFVLASDRTRYTCIKECPPNGIVEQMKNYTAPRVYVVSCFDTLPVEAPLLS